LPRTNSRFAQGVFLVFVTVLLWGVQFPVAKSAFASVDAFHVTAIRYALGALALVGLLVWLEGQAALSYRGRFLAAALVGLVGMCASPMLVFPGLALSTPEHAAIIVALQPSMTALADWVLRGRRPGRFTLACLALAFAGVVTVVTRGDPVHAFTRGGITGDILVFLGAGCWVGYTMAAETFKGWSALRFTTLTIVPGSLGCVAVTAVLVAAGVSVVPGTAALAGIGWHLVYLTLGGIVISMLCWNAGNQRIGALNTMLLMNLVPVVTFAVRFAQGARPTSLELFGAALVISSLVANNLYLRRVSARKTSEAKK
jgi:drug/metabolite transporter (DMT)-like permease